jgi:hypothetical protein
MGRFAGRVWSERYERCFQKALVYRKRVREDLFSDGFVPGTLPTTPEQRLELLELAAATGQQWFYESDQAQQELFKLRNLQLRAPRKSQGPGYLPVAAQHGVPPVRRRDLEGQ